MLRMKRAEAGRRVAEEQERLERVETRLRLIEKEGKMPEQEVVVKQVPELQGLGMRDRVAGPPGIGQFFGDGFAALGMAGVMLAGPPVTVYHDPEFLPRVDRRRGGVPGAAGVKGPLPTPAGRALEPRTVPGGEVAVLVHVGPYEPWRGVPGAAGWIGQHGYGVSGRRARSTLSSPQDPGPPVTEIRMPVEKR